MWSVIRASIAGVTRNVTSTRQKLYHATYKATVALGLSSFLLNPKTKRVNRLRLVRTLRFPLSIWLVLIRSKSGSPLIGVGTVSMTLAGPYHSGPALSRLYSLAIDSDAKMCPRTKQMSRRKVVFQGNEVWGEEIEFETDHEGWNTYVLHDGTRLKMKSVVSDVVRVEEAYNPDGTPIYIVNATNIVTTVVPESLKKKQE